MGLRFFADQCVPTTVTTSLANAGYQVYCLRDYLPIESPDSIVIAKAQELAAILISLNGDFANILDYPPVDYQGIVALRIRNHPEVLPEIVSRLKNYLLANPSMGHYKGKLILVEAHRIRIRQ